MNVLAYDGLLLLLVGVTYYNLKQETVGLGFGKRISTLLLYGVLCGHYEEGPVEIEGMVADGHLALLHGFEQSALYLGRGTVYFVGKHEVGENRAFLDLEFLLLDAVDHCADNVGGKQVRSKLYAVITRVDEFRQRLDS